MAYKLIKMLAPVRPNGARPGIKLDKIAGVTIHMTDNWGKGAGAISHANYLKNGGANLQASWHYCIDDKNATQSIPDDEVAWHAGNHTGNHTTIGIEICLNPESDLKTACDNAAKLAASLLKKYKLGINRLYRHYDWSGKHCPSMMMDGKPYTWATFKNKVQAELNNSKPVNETTTTKPASSSSSIKVGTTVKFNGKVKCYTSSEGGSAGTIPPAGNYKVTHYSANAKYPIHIGTYGWVTASSCEVVKNDKIAVGKTVTFDGKVRCYESSTGGKTGSIPKAGNYKVTHYNEGAKYAVHIGTAGWVEESHCKLK